MPVLPEEGSIRVSPGSEQALLLGVLDHAERNAVLYGSAGVLPLELHEDPGMRVGAECAHLDERRIAYETENALVECHPRRSGPVCSGPVIGAQPPATAGRIEMVSPFDTLVASLSR